MKETLNNLKKVYKYGKEYNKNLIAFTVLSFAFVIVNVIYPIFTAKQITYLSTGLFQQLATVTLVVFGLELLRILRMVLIKRNTQVYFTGVFKKLQLAISKEILKIKVSDMDNNSSGVCLFSDKDEGLAVRRASRRILLCAKARSSQSDFRCRVQGWERETSY